MLKINVAGSDGAGPVNEDVAGYCDVAAWVIDGATGVGDPLLDTPSDAAWLANYADRMLRRLLRGTPDIPTPQLLASVMAMCRDELARKAIREADAPHEYPSAAFAMVRLLGDAVELVTLGDCRIAYEERNGEAILFGKSEIETFEAKTIALAAEILRTEPDIAPSDLKDRLLPQLQENRRMMNREGGYWVFGVDPTAADHLDISRVERTPGRRFAIASDGWLRLVELFSIAKPRDLIETHDIARFEHWRDRLRAIEIEPNSRQRYPRVKIHDDASFIGCEIA